MMIKVIKNINIHYEEEGDISNQALVLLHGWGQNIEMMQPLALPFKEDFHIINIDLPGHGRSSEPKEVLNIYEYADIIYELLMSLNIYNPIVIGHSFGGKLAIILTSKMDISKIVLCASPYKASKKNKSLKTKFFKAVKKIPGLSKLANEAKKHIGSSDYRNASPVMREILVKHVNEDVTNYAANIKCPTLLIWGTNDEAVSIKDAYELETLIADCGLVIYDGATHYAYLEHLNEVISVLRVFLIKEED